jgi:cobalt-zinc-cadmium efflux system membrane fusion protein
MQYSTVSRVSHNAISTSSDLSGTGEPMSDLVVPQASPETMPARFGRALLLMLIGAEVGVAGERYVGTQRAMPTTATQLEQSRSAAQSAFTRVGNRIVVPPNSPLRTRLVLEEPLMREVAHTLMLPAVVEADPARTVKVMPPAAGRVIDLMVQLGGRVVQGQELAVIDSADLAQAYADIAKSRSSVTLTKKTLDRQMGLEKAGGAAIKDREQAQSDYTQAVAELDRAESRLRAMGVSADPKDTKAPSHLLSLKAPVSGSVIDLQMAPGAFLNDPTAAAMTIANLDTIWVTANVPEKDTSFVAVDQPVTVTFPAYPGKLFDGKVLFISDVLEPDTRRTKVRIAFDNPDKRLKPGMFANASFSAPMESRLVLPTSALLMSNERISIFVEVEPWTFERRDVETDYEEGETAVIRSSLKPGERVIIKGGVVFND